MVSRPRLLIAVAFVAAFGCRRSVAPLDDVQRMAYGVKPAVVRVNAYATAQFSYPSQAISNVIQELRRNGVVVAAAPAAEREVVETGAGGSGSGFVVHPDGLILTS